MTISGDLVATQIVQERQMRRKDRADGGGGARQKEISNYFSLFDCLRGVAMERVPRGGNPKSFRIYRFFLCVIFDLEHLSGFTYVLIFSLFIGFLVINIFK